MSALTRFRRGRDRGAVAATVVVLLASGALLGFAALAVDVGVMYAEREELQSGADAAALAVAKACATASLDGCIDGDPDSEPEVDVYETAQSYANRNASDGRATVVEVCGRDPGRRLHSCSSQPTNLTKCIGPAPETPYVEVRLGTRTASGSTVLPPIFAQTVMGTGTDVRVCARASFMLPNHDPLAFSLSLCEFEDATTGPGDGITTPGNWSDALEWTIFTHRNNPGSSCDDDTPPAGWVRPGDFEWLQGKNSDCVADIDEDDGEVRSSNGNSWGDCNERIEELLDDSGPTSYTIVLIPVVDGCNDGFLDRDCRERGNDDADLHVAGYAPFVITGYVHTRNDRERSWQTNNFPCAGDNNDSSEGCISGFFVGPLERTLDPDRIFVVRPSIVG
jgi:hypothetical protein